MARIIMWLCCTVLFGTTAILPTLAATTDVTKFETRLLPSPVSDLTAASVTGAGLANASLDHNKLVVNGSFDGLASPATEGHLFTGAGIGVPGKPVLDLTISQATDGTISGEFDLTSLQVKALREGRIYIQINTQKTTTPYGTLWGWLLPDHATVLQGVPEQGHWFLPQYDVPQSESAAH